MSWQSVDRPHVQVSPTAGERFAARLVILLLAACVGIALFDLYQLLAGIN